MTRKATFFDGLSWFKFNNLGLTLGMTLKFYTSLAKGLKLKVRKFYVWRSYRGKTGRRAFLSPQYWIGLKLKTLLVLIQKPRFINLYWNVKGLPNFCKISVEIRGDFTTDMGRVFPAKINFPNFLRPQEELQFLGMKNQIFLENMTPSPGKTTNSLGYFLKLIIWDKIFTQLKACSFL